MKKITLIFWLVMLINSVAVAQTLNIATDNWLPYEDINNPQAPGFSTEVIRQVFNQMGVEANINEYPWKRAVKETFDGRRDALYSAFFKEERALKCYYPEEPLLTAKYFLYIRSQDVGRLSFNSLQDLKGKRIGVLRGGGYPKEFLEFIKKHAIVEEVTKNDQNFSKLALGRVDYIIAEHGNGSVLTKQLGLTEIVVPILSKAIREDGLYLIFSKKTTTPEFVKNFSDALHTFKKIKDYQLIYKKYFIGS